MKTASAGMTLIELLVAFAVFILLVAALVSLATMSLDSWTQGEARKDTYDRAQAVLGQIADDLRNAYSENEFYTDGNKDLMAAAFLCDTDLNGKQRLRFVRGGDMDSVQVPPKLQIRKITPNMYYGDTWEVLYVMDSDPAKNVLHRGIRYFDRRLKFTFLNDEDIEKTTNRIVIDNSAPLETGVLYVGFKFWTQETVSWNPPRSRYFTCGTPGHRPLVQLRDAGKCPMCGKDLAERAVEDKEAPSLIWDSTRKQEGAFRYHKRRIDRTDPDFVYPEIVRVEVVIESNAPDIKGLRLLDAIDEKATVLRVNETKGLGDPPGFVKIDAEWIEYSKRSFDEIQVKARGARGTKAEPHGKGAAVHYGETFVMEVHIPSYREAVIK